MSDDPFPPSVFNTFRELIFLLIEEKVILVDENHKMTDVDLAKWAEAKQYLREGDKDFAEKCMAAIAQVLKERKGTLLIT